MFIWVSALLPLCYAQTTLHSDVHILVLQFQDGSGKSYNHSAPTDAQQQLPCRDLHICCSEIFKNRSDCQSGADFESCPKSCGLCSSAECRDSPDICKGRKNECSDPKNGNSMKTQCPVTCGTCGKTARSLGITCEACNDTLPNCYELSAAGFCDISDENYKKCGKTCGCFVNFKLTLT